ncbi:MAG TPA: ShlB/FhaC/HecB family hemolysin secretion/activation protein [Methylomusa anaerophila]|uniref:Heme/hemopexin transporter protein HuxB n=1 Tax=Methylomusa anaerophila TaxID=1930071 RepID=A0A348ALU8_9FIRM|nr:ShlB/FhaC/HecB family hemolysin secretion/activation protein [Methylomusa anaerophila]BBB92046.1 heme/hemopexin transporter protein HuxB precursor [Methylomusa anaerophila]HML87942.1 ShlB/FhaC/HecB family hemolysin secretion/activation protein [Methylomusa anaerophila]
MRIKQVAVGTLLSLSLTGWAVLAAFAQAPDAGKIGQSVKQAPPNLPLSPPAKLDISPTEEQVSDTTSENELTVITVRGFHIAGQTVYSEKELLALVKEAVGQELTLQDLHNVAARITKYYRRHGYLVAAAYIPAQDVTDGIVRIDIREGRYGKIQFSGDLPVSEQTIRRALGVKSGQIIAENALERGMLSLNDIPGLTARGTLTVGDTTGTSDLIIKIQKARTVSGSLTVNNFANSFTGKNQLSFNTNFYNLSGSGDLAAIRGDATGPGLTNGKISYTAPGGIPGLSFGAAYARMHYKLGDDFASLDASGYSTSTLLSANYVLNRSRDHNLYAQIGYEGKRLQDKVNASGTVTDKKADTITISITGDSQDKFAGGGISSYSLAHTWGNLDIMSADAKTNDDITAQTSGRFEKTTLNIIRLQRIADRVSLYSCLTGQLAGKNLESSEKIILGGANGVRAYPQGEASGDEGYLATCELRYLLPLPQDKTGIFQLIGFYDTGKVTLNKNLWPGYSGVNSRTLAGAGVGLQYVKPGHYFLRVDYAKKIGRGEAQSDTDKNGRLWVQMINYF